MITTSLMETRSTDNAAAGAQDIPALERDGAISGAATPLWLTATEVEALMTLCLSDNRPSDVNDGILEKLAMAWRRLQ